MEQDAPMLWDAVRTAVDKPGGKGRADVFANAMKHEPKEQREQSQACLDSAESRLRKSKAQFKSKNPTTRWSDIIKLK